MPGLCIGLTGGIASGKSTVGTCFSDLGVQVTDADQVARDIVQPGMPALHAIVETFGPAMLLDNGQLNRPAMRKRVFSNAAERQRLEAITHPRIHEELQRHRDACTDPYCVLMIPLLARNIAMQALVQRLLVVDCPVEMQRQRLLCRDDISEDLADAMISAQESRETRLSVADDVISNTGSPEDLKSQVAKLHQQYLMLGAP